MSMHPTRNLFKEFPNEVFIETGSYRGDGIQLAQDAGFQKIISIDVDKDNLEFCLNRFNLKSSHPSITAALDLHHGDSSEYLYEIIYPIQERITFWLDSHWQMLEGTEPIGHPFPLLKELQQIKKHHRNDHTIIIDDMLIMQKDIVGYDTKEIVATLKSINPLYTLQLFANPVINNILVAYV